MAVSRMARAGGPPLSLTQVLAHEGSALVSAIAAGPLGRARIPAPRLLLPRRNRSILLNAHDPESGFDLQVQGDRRDGAGDEQWPL